MPSFPAEMPEYPVDRSDGQPLVVINAAGFIRPCPPFKDFREALRKGLNDPQSHSLCQCLLKAYSTPSKDRGCQTPS